MGEALSQWRWRGAPGARRGDGGLSRLRRPSVAIGAARRAAPRRAKLAANPGTRTACDCGVRVRLSARTRSFPGRLGDPNNEGERAACACCGGAFVPMEAPLGDPNEEGEECASASARLLGRKGCARACGDRRRTRDGVMAGGGPTSSVPSSNDSRMDLSLEMLMLPLRSRLPPTASHALAKSSRPLAFTPLHESQRQSGACCCWIRTSAHPHAIML